jgi:hypothetical protein
MGSLLHMRGIGQFLTKGVGAVLGSEVRNINLCVEVDEDMCFELEFEAPKQESLQEGIYKNARRIGFQNDSPGLSLQSTGRGFNDSLGIFQVHEISMHAQEDIVFSASFHLGEANQDEVIRGEVRFSGNATKRENSLSGMGIGTPDKCLHQPLIPAFGCSITEFDEELKELVSNFKPSYLDFVAKEEGIWSKRGLDLTPSPYRLGIDNTHPLFENESLKSIVNMLMNSVHLNEFRSSEVDYDFFIAFKGEDRNVALNLMDQLTNCGCSVFVDSSAMEIGEHLDNSVAKAINGTRFFVLIWSSSLNNLDAYARMLGVSGTCSSRAFAKTVLLCYVSTKHHYQTKYLRHVVCKSEMSMRRQTLF